MEYDKLNKASKIVILSTLDQARHLSEISQKWFGNNTRYYLNVYQKQVEDGVKKGFLIKEGKKYKANTERIINEAISEINFGFTEKKLQRIVEDYKIRLKWIFKDIKDFSYPAYLSIDMIHDLTGGDSDAIVTLNFQNLIQLPFILAYIEKKSKSILNLVLNLTKLEKYYESLFESENINSIILKRMKKEAQFGEYCNYITGYYTKFFDGDENLLNSALNSIKA